MFFVNLTVRYGERSVRWELTVAKKNTSALTKDVLTLEVEEEN